MNPKHKPLIPGRTQVLGIILVILSLVFFEGCSAGPISTVIPRQVVSHQASFDGNTQNSGIISSNGRGFLVTPHFIDRYNSLINLYGEKLLPPLKEGDKSGITPEGANFRIDAHTFVNFGKMNAMRKRDLSKN